VLVKKLEDIKDKSKGMLRPMELVNATLLSKLRKRWSPDAVIREDRSEGYGSVDVDSGLDSLHWQFGGWKLQQDSDGKLDSQGESESNNEIDKDVLTVERDEFIIDADAELYAAIAAESGDSEEQEEIEQAVQEEVEMEFYNAVVDNVSRGEECACVNRSRKGYYLTWSGEGEYATHVGDLIGINSKDGSGNDSWSLGVIRWMRVHSNGLLGFGIELFEGAIESVRLDFHHEGSAKNDSIPGFLQKNNGKVETLIARPFFYGSNDKLIMTSADGKMPIEPMQAVECTDAYMRFKVHFDSSVMEIKEERSKISSKAEELLNNIWDEL
jgi:hypothetical protein